MVWLARASRAAAGRYASARGHRIFRRPVAAARPVKRKPWLAAFAVRFAIQPRGSSPKRVQRWPGHVRLSPTAPAPSFPASWLCPFGRLGLLGFRATADRGASPRPGRRSDVAGRRCGSLGIPLESGGAAQVGQGAGGAARRFGKLLFAPGDGGFHRLCAAIRRIHGAVRPGYSGRFAPQPAGCSRTGTAERAAGLPSTVAAAFALFSGQVWAGCG